MEESFAAPDGRRRTLWPDVYTAMAAAKRAYGSSSRTGTRERGWMFRGQADADWELIPSLYRPPNDQETVKKRLSYSAQFLEHFKLYSPAVGVGNLDEGKCLAVAQHYGFCTNYLDFTWNIDVAAYFATATNHDSEVGVIYMYSLSEYKDMFEVSQHIAERDEAARSKKWWGRMPPLRIEEFTDVPRITAQEGIFVQVQLGSEKTVLRQCIDRIYFRQHPGLAYKGQLQVNTGSLLDRSAFDSEETYQHYIRMVREQMPSVFDREPAVTEGSIFPLDDPISSYVLTWRLFNSDPFTTAKHDRTHLQDGDDVVLNGLLPSRLWLGELANLLQFSRGQSALFVLPDISFLASLVRSLRLILFGEQPNLVGLAYYKGKTAILDMDRYLNDFERLEVDLEQACREKDVIIILIGSGRIPAAHHEFLRRVGAVKPGARQAVFVAIAARNMYHNRSLPASFGAGRIYWLT